MDKSFADCSIPQEKSNADINAELDISDASCEEDANGDRCNSKGLDRRHSAGIDLRSCNIKLWEV